MITLPFDIRLQILSLLPPSQLLSLLRSPIHRTLVNDISCLLERRDYGISFLTHVQRNLLVAHNEEVQHYLCSSNGGEELRRIWHLMTLMKWIENRKYAPCKGVIQECVQRARECACDFRSVLWSYEVGARIYDHISFI